MPHPAQSSSASIILRGSLITLRRKCGTPTCRCLKGNLHETPALSYSLRGSTKMLTLRPQDVPGVRAALKRYQKGVRVLEQEALAGIRAFRQRVQKDKAQTRRARGR
jgi:uncharacterized protein YaiL (DUF2058 family)